MLVALSLACAPSLDAADADRRRRAVVWLDVDEIRANLPRLVEIAEHDPAPEVRREAILALGSSGDPTVEGVLHRVAPDQPGATRAAWVLRGACAQAAGVPVARDDPDYTWWWWSDCGPTQ